MGHILNYEQHDHGSYKVIEWPETQQNVTHFCVLNDSVKIPKMVQTVCVRRQ